MKTILLLIILLAANASAVLGCATIPVQGRVFKPSGVGFRPVSGAIITDGAIAVRSNPFGYYHTEIPNCGETVFEILGKGLRFEPVTFFLPFAQDNPLWSPDGILHVDFVALSGA